MQPKMIKYHINSYIEKIDITFEIRSFFAIRYSTGTTLNEVETYSYFTNTPSYNLLDNRRKLGIKDKDYGNINRL